MAKTRFFGGQFWKDITQAAKYSKRRHVDVAFLTGGAVECLSLGKGGTFVVNAGDDALRNGSTQPKELRTYLDTGVHVYSCADLHGKVFLFDRTATVGSINVSAKSYTDLHEAALLTREPMAVAAAHEFIEELPKDPVDEKFLKRAEAIYRPPFGSRQLR